MGQYGRIGKRRSGSATWQWMLLGFFPGILCGGVLIFAMFASGALNSLTSASLPTGTAVIIREVQIITATPEPTTDAPTTVAPTETPNVAVGTIESIALPSPTTFALVPTNAAVSTGPTATSIGGSQAIEQTTAAGVNPLPTVAGAVAAAPTSGVPAALQSGLTAMSLISGGTFTMGTTPDEVIAAVAECVNRDEGTCLEADGIDSSPQFQVQLNTFQMERTEVTFAQYIAFLNYLRAQGKNHRDACPSPNGASSLCIQTVNENQADAVITFDSNNYNVPPGLLQHPVYGVTWAGAYAYCQSVGRRLPTEAEWEFAAKGIDPGRLYPWGNLWNPANAKTRIPRDIPAGTVAVGSYPGGTTTNGLLDMAGNVREWVSDWYGDTYYSELDNQAQPVMNPTGPLQGTEKVLRGGSWDTMPMYVRTVHRLSWAPAPDGNESTFPRDIGFRCAADAPTSAPGATSIPVTNGTPDPLNLGVNIPPAVTPTTSSAGAEGTPITGGQQG